jgi:hypothetical protein
MADGDPSQGRNHTGRPQKRHPWGGRAAGLRLGKVRDEEQDMPRSPDYNGAMELQSLEYKIVTNSRLRVAPVAKALFDGRGDRLSFRHASHERGR